MIDNTPEPINRSREPYVVRAGEVLYANAVPPYESAQPEGTSGLVEYWRVLVRHKGTVLLTVILGALVGYLSTVSDTPIYRAHTSLEVLAANGNPMSMVSMNPMASPYSMDPTLDILTQVQLLQSSSLRAKAIGRMNKHGVTSSHPGVEVDRIEEWKKALHLSPATQVTWGSALEMAASSLAVRASGTTRIIDITADSSDPAVAAAFANDLVAEFIDQDMQGRLTDTEHTSDWLVKQLDDLKIKLEKSEDQLQAYANSMGLQMTSGTGGKDGVRENVADEKLRQLQTEMLAAQAERIKTQSKYELVSGAPLDSLPQVVEDPSLRDFQSKLSELRRQYAELTTTLTPENPKVRKVQAQIEELESTRLRERTDLVKKIENEYKAAERREQLLGVDYALQLKLVGQQASKAIHYDILKREVDTNQQIYESILQKVKEAGVASALKASNYRVLDPAKPPDGPYTPRPARSASIGSMAGLILGILFVLTRERSDRSIQQPGDSMLYLNLPELGVIPSDRAAAMAKLYGGTGGPTPISGMGDDIALTTARRIPGILTESFHDALTSILLSTQNGAKPKVIVMTSSTPSEGKTTVTSNLAVTLADINQRVLLIDADMRRPRLHKLFNLSNEQGLSTLLANPTRILKRPGPPVISETEVRNLTVMTSGPVATNASNLLHSPRLEELLQEMRNEFDVVLIDTPPMLQLADARIIAQHADAVILVVRAGRTTRDTARAACQKFRQDGTPILGTILNDWMPGSNGSGYDTKYYASHSKYYNVKPS